MCGIAGVITRARSVAGILAPMIERVAHRGPDDQGSWADYEAGVALGHRRLSIVDLSPAGHEPMHSVSGRYVVTFNGEIYNHAELRSELDRQNLTPEGGWRGHSDIETLLQAIDCWGLQPALSRAVGMFAFGLWDRQERELNLVRDRFGEKPLYYGWIGKDFLFASELKAFRAHAAFDGEIDRNALRLFASRTYIPAPFSIYRRIFKLLPGCILTVPAAAAAEPLDTPPEEGVPSQLRLVRYWSYRKLVRDGLADPIADETEALTELNGALARSVSEQSIADVPVGMFLSGGIDSSTIAAFYQRTSSQTVRTFSIGFEDPRYDEAPCARRVADQLGTVHHEQIVTERDALDAIPLLPRMYDEPFGDSSQIPTYLVSRLARSQVTVALTGDGGDELFGGYYRHFYAPQLWRRIRPLPRAVRRLGAPLSRFPAQLWSRAAGLLPEHGRSNLGAKIQKALRVASSARSVDDVYESFLDEWSFETSPVLGSENAAGWDLNGWNNAPDEVRLMYCDAVSYLPDDILCKVDRASMAVSLETRVPFLDHRVASVAARIPIELKINGSEGKSIVRKLLYREAPRELFQRPKAGFAIPVSDWLKGPLRSWAEELLDERRLLEEGWFDPNAVRLRWSEHLSGRRDSRAAIWAILMFEAWLDEQRGNKGVARAELEPA
jgi:asparagine synthase (glutamine-hydrolysing)